MVEDCERERLAEARDRWQARVAALALARHDVQRLYRLLARDPGGRLAQRAQEVSASLALAERVARAELALAERKLADGGTT